MILEGNAMFQDNNAPINASRPVTELHEYILVNLNMLHGHHSSHILNIYYAFKKTIRIQYPLPSSLQDWEIVLAEQWAEITLWLIQTL